MEKKKRKREKRIQDIHKEIVDYQERTRTMTEIMRQKKIEEEQSKKHEFDQNAAEAKTVKDNTEIDAVLSARGGTSVKGANTSVSLLKQPAPSINPQTKIKYEQVHQLEKKCQRMIFEKEDKYVATEQKLKDED